MAGKGQKPEPEPVTVDGVTIDAEWFAEWVAAGFKALSGYLANYAKFSDWYDLHNPPEDIALD